MPGALWGPAVGGAGYISGEFLRGISFTMGNNLSVADARRCLDS